jgi:hypothetical protein
MPRTAAGTTAEASSVILGAQFWKPNTKLTGIYVRSFPTKLQDGTVSECHQFLCMMPEVIEVPTNGKGRVDYKDGKPTKVDKFAIGALTGIEMALDALRVNAPWFRSFEMRDKVTFSCTGVQPGENGNSDMPEFLIEVER